jgi:hypothetical protein
VSSGYLRLGVVQNLGSDLEDHFRRRSAPFDAEENWYIEINLGSRLVECLLVRGLGVL